MFFFEQEIEITATFSFISDVICLHIHWYTMEIEVISSNQPIIGRRLAAKISTGNTM